jgi:hypothetical protein
LEQEAAKAYQMQAATETQAPVTISSAPIPDASASDSVEGPMNIDHPVPERGTKRGAEENETPSEPHKKARTGKFFCIVRKKKKY